MIRPEPYSREHAASHRPRDYRVRPGSLRALLRWAHSQYELETPNLDHSHHHLDDDGAPSMSGAVRAYLALNPPKDGKDDEYPDNWLAIASAKDEDGFYRTPLRRAIETLPKERRLLLRDVVPEVLMPSDVLALHGIPAWAASDVLYRSLVMLWDRYLDRPLPSTGYLSKSDAQRAAEDAA